MKNVACRLSCCYAVVLFLGIRPLVNGADVRLNVMELPSDGLGKPCVLNALKAKAEESPTGVNTAEEMLRRLRGLGDAVYEAGSSNIWVASGRSAAMSRERVKLLAAKAPSTLVESRDLVKSLKQGDFFLIGRVDGGYALFYVREFAKDRHVTLAWVLNAGGDAPFSKDEVDVLLAAGEKKAPKAEHGVATLLTLAGASPTVFSFAAGDVKKFRGDLSEVMQDEDYGARTAYSRDLFKAADVAYGGWVPQVPYLWVVSKKGCVLGRGALADFAGMDLSTNHYDDASLLDTNTLVSGTVIAVKDREGKYGLLRVETANTNGLKMQWAYMPDGSSAFPVVPPLPDAVATVPFVKPPPVVKTEADLKRAATDRLWKMVNLAGGRPDSEVRADVLKLVAEGADPNVAIASTWAQGTMLMRAAANDHRALVDALLEAGADINREEPLHAAAGAGKAEMCKYLISRGADPAYRGRIGRTAFEVAQMSRTPSLDAMKVCVPEGELGRTLHIAVMLGDTNVLKELVSEGKDLNTCDVNGMTPLQLAAKAGRIDACKILVDAGCDVDRGINNRRHGEGLLLSIAVGACQTQTVAFLVDKVTDGQKGNAYINASVAGQRAIAEIILASVKDPTAFYRGADFDTLLLKGWKQHYDMLKSRDVALPLGAAAAVGDTNAVMKAIEAGVDVRLLGTNMVNNVWAQQGKTPFSVAVENGQIPTARLLLAAGADPNSLVSPSGDTPLLAAARQGDFEFAELLVKHKGAVNVANTMGETPLFCAVKKGDARVVRLLLEAGADQTNIPALRPPRRKATTLPDHTKDREILALLAKYKAK